MLVEGPDQSFDILRETTPSVSDPSVEEGLTDPGITSDPLPDEVYICAYALAEASDHIHERDPGREHLILRVLRDLGGGNIHEEDRVTAPDEGLVEVSHDLARILLLDSYHHTVRPHEVIDCSPLLEEFRVGADMEGLLGELGDHLTDPLGGTNGHGTLRDHHLLIIHILADRTSHSENILEIRSEEHTSELQSRGHLVCRLLLEK